MHPSTLSRPSPKRSLSCAGLDDLDELIHSSDIARPCPNRKRHQSLSNFSVPDFSTSSSSSRDDYPPLSASYAELRRPELPTFDEKSSSSAERQQVSSSSFELRPSSYHVQAIDQRCNPPSDDEDNNYEDECNDAGEVHDYQSSGHFSMYNMASEEPQDVFDHKLKLDHDALTTKRLDHNSFFPLSYRSSSSECSPREEYLIHAFGPSGFKLHGASVSNNDDMDDSLSDDSSNNDREQSSSTHEGVTADADTELKMSFTELEADIHGAMHPNSHDQQHSARLPEFAGLSHQSFASPSQSLFGLSRSSSFLRNNQDKHHVSEFTQPQNAHPHLLPNQTELRYFPTEQHHQSSSCASSLGKASQSKGSTGVQTSTKWLRDEDECLREAVARFGGKNWKMIAETLGNGRTDVQCLHRWNKVLKPGLIKGPWTPEEDRILTSLITRYGIGKIRWCDLALHLPGRIGKQCRERWCNHLDSRIRKGQWTSEEDDMVFRWQQKLGNKWSEIAKLLPGRTENAVKNRFNSAARRKWLMNQADKSTSSLLIQTTPTTKSQSSHVRLQQQHPFLQPTSPHQEGNIYNVGTNLYGGDKVLPLPLTEASSEHDLNKTNSPHKRQNFSQHFSSPGTPGTIALLPSGLDETGSFCPDLAMGGEQYFQHQDHDETDEAAKGDSMQSTPPPTFVPPPLNSLFSSTLNTGTGASCGLHHLANGPGDALISPVFPFPDYLPTQLQHSPAEKSTLGDTIADKKFGLPLLQLKEKKAEQGDLEATHDVPASNTAIDPSIHMDDENMNSFLDSVALELDDIME